MNTQHLPPCGPALAALFSLLLFPLPQTWAQPVDGQVEIRGELLLAGTERVGNLEVVELDNRVCVPLHIRPNGRFTLKLAAGNKAYLRFEQAGYLTKEVLVDTRNANLTRQAARKNSTLHFAVQMTPELPDKELAYAGPVGIITFRKGTGLMKVSYDRSMVRNRNGEIVTVGTPQVH